MLFFGNLPGLNLQTPSSCSVQSLVCLFSFLFFFLFLFLFIPRGHTCEIRHISIRSVSLTLRKVRRIIPYLSVFSLINPGTLLLTSLHCSLFPHKFSTRLPVDKKQETSKLKTQQRKKKNPINQ